MKCWEWLRSRNWILLKFFWMWFCLWLKLWIIVSFFIIRRRSRKNWKWSKVRWFWRKFVLVLIWMSMIFSLSLFMFVNFWKKEVKLKCMFFFVVVLLYLRIVERFCCWSLFRNLVIWVCWSKCWNWKGNEWLWWLIWKRNKNWKVKIENWKYVLSDLFFIFFFLDF